MLPMYFAAEETAEHAVEGLPLGLNATSLAIQLVTFILVFLLLKKFAFSPIVKLLDKRHKVIEEGVRHGIDMQREREKLEKETAKIIREARHGADEIIGDAQKEARDIVRNAEKAAHSKSENILKDAEARVAEETEQAKRRLEKDVANLVSEATEALVEEKVDSKKDADLIDKAIKRGKKR
jgi:F-type H+-transporting ATPase subunit b